MSKEKRTAKKLTKKIEKTRAKIGTLTAKLERLEGKQAKRAMKKKPVESDRIEAPTSVH
jgi:BMFP domain-containing protein YqiC